MLYWDVDKADPNQSMIETQTSQSSGWLLTAGKTSLSKVVNIVRDRYEDKNLVP